MGIFDGLIGQLGAVSDVTDLAAKVGIDPATAEKAIAALGTAHTQPGDTVAGAAAATGLDSGILNQIVGHIGGEGSLGQYASLISSVPAAGGLLSKLDLDGDGNPLNDIAGLASNLFGKK